MWKRVEGWRRLQHIEDGTREVDRDPNKELWPRQEGREPLVLTVAAVDAHVRGQLGVSELEHFKLLTVEHLAHIEGAREWRRETA